MHCPDLVYRLRDIDQTILSKTRSCTGHSENVRCLIGEMIDVTLAGHRQFGTPLPESLERVLAKYPAERKEILGHD
jgi:hypothetical protein